MPPIFGVCYRSEEIAPTGDLLSVSSLIFSATSAILELKGCENEIFSLCMMFKKVISFIYEHIYFGDRVPFRSPSLAGNGF